MGERIRYEIYHAHKIIGPYFNFWFILGISLVTPPVVFSGGKAVLYFSDEMKISIDHIPLDSTEVAKRLEYYQNKETYRNASYAENLKLAKWDVERELRKKLKDQMIEQYWSWAKVWCIPVIIFCFGILSCATVYRIRVYAKEEKLKAEDTKKERTNLFRKNYVAKHKDELLSKTEQIKSSHQALILNTKKREYFDRFVSGEVFKMWDEEYKLWQMATGYYEVAEEEKDEVEEVLEKTRKAVVLKAKKYAIEALGMAKGRKALDEEYRRERAEILKGRSLTELTAGELQLLQDLEDEYQSAIDNLGTPT